MSNYKVLVINLERSPERLAGIKSQLDALGIGFERIEAVDGKKLSNEEIERAAPARIVSRTYHRTLSRGEVACGLSHRRAWQKIVDDRLDFAIVLEDDAGILENFVDVIRLVATLPEGTWDYIKLFPLTKAGNRNIAKRFDYMGHTFVIYHRFPLGFCGQAISRCGAQAMLANLPYVTEPADSQLKSWWDAGIYPFGLLPYCVHHEFGATSDINPEGKLEEMPQNKWVKATLKIRRTFMRLWSTPKLNRRFRKFTDSLQAHR